MSWGMEARPPLIPVARNIPFATDESHCTPLLGTTRHLGGRESIQQDGISGSAPWLALNMHRPNLSGSVECSEIIKKLDIQNQTRTMATGTRTEKHATMSIEAVLRRINERQVSGPDPKPVLRLYLQGRAPETTAVLQYADQAGIVYHVLPSYRSQAKAAYGPRRVFGVKNIQKLVDFIRSEQP